MAQVLINVREEQKAAWVAAAHDERVSLSEWVRRRCDGGLGAGEVEGLPSSPAARVSRPVGSPAPAPSPRDAALRDAQSLRERSEGDAAAVERIVKGDSFRPDPKVKKGKP